MYSSKWYDEQRCYWFAITPNTIAKYGRAGTESLVFELKGEGLLTLPYSIIEEVAEAYSSTGKDYCSYKMYIRKRPLLTLVINVPRRKWDVQDYFTPHR